MSSTNRAKGGYVRHEDDFYETPAWCTRALITHFRKVGLMCPSFKPIQSVLDPFSGRGAILDVFKEEGASTFGIELNEERAIECKRAHKTWHADAFDKRSWPACDAIVTNPPFFAALEGIGRAFYETKGFHATVAFLLRLNFLGSKKRSVLHTETPAEVLIMSERPSFRPDGKTDSIEYAWFLWGEGTKPGNWSILPTNRKGE